MENVIYCTKYIICEIVTPILEWSVHLIQFLLCFFHRQHVAMDIPTRVLIPAVTDAYTKLLAENQVAMIDFIEINYTASV